MSQLLIQNPDDPTEVCLVDSLEGREGWTVLPASDADAVVLADRKAEMRRAVNFLRDRKQDSTAASPIGRIQVDEKSKTKINGLVSMASLAKQAGEPFLDSKGNPVRFTNAEDERVPVDADAMIAVGIAAGAHVMNCHNHAAELKESIEEAASLSDLEAVDIEEGWP